MVQRFSVLSIIMLLLFVVQTPQGVAAEEFVQNMTPEQKRQKEAMLLERMQFLSRGLNGMPEPPKIKNKRLSTTSAGGGSGYYGDLDLDIDLDKEFEFDNETMDQSIDEIGAELDALARDLKADENKGV